MRQLDRIPAITAQVDRARRGDGVALQAQQLFVAVAARQHERERPGEQHDRHRRHPRDREHEAPSHVSRPRAGSRRHAAS
jgi:hypothetical protein